MNYKLNTTLATLIKAGLFLVSLLLVVPLSNAQLIPEEGNRWASYYNLSTGSMSTYEIPDWAEFEYVNASTAGTIELTMQGSPPSTADKFALVTYFDGDVAVVYCHSGYSAPTTPTLAPGEAAVVRVSDNEILEYADVSVAGNVVTLSFTGSLVSGVDPMYAVSCYLPSSHNLANVAGGFSVCFVDALDLYGIYFEESAATAQAEFMCGDDSLSMQSTSAAKFAVHCSVLSSSSADIIPIYMPGRGLEYRCPPSGPNAGTIPKNTDINGDGRTDWKYPVSISIPGTGITIEVWGLDLAPSGPSPSDEYAVVIKQNGVIQDTIGRCPWPGGQNKWWLQKHGDGKWYVHCVSRWPEASGGSNPGHMAHYIYDPSTNTLKCWIIDRNGNQVDYYEGDPEDCPYLRPIEATEPGGGGCF